MPKVHRQSFALFCYIVPPDRNPSPNRGSIDWVQFIFHAAQFGRVRSWWFRFGDKTFALNSSTKLALHGSTHVSSNQSHDRPDRSTGPGGIINGT